MQFRATSPQTAVAPPLNGAPLITIQPFSVLNEVKTNKKNNNRSKLNNALRFVDLRCLRDGLWPIIFLKNQQCYCFVIKHLFPSAWERPSNHKHDLFLSLAQFWTCRCAVQIWSVFVKSSFLMLGGSFERKSSSEDKKVINVENLELTQDFRSLQNEKPVSGLLSVQSVSTLRSASAS